LLKRMSEMEATTSGEGRNPGLEPRKLDLRKASVEDLRRLYEERGRTAEGLAKADAARRMSTST
jgi:Rho GTPase-activating protein 1